MATMPVQWAMPHIPAVPDLPAARPLDQLAACTRCDDLQEQFQQLRQSHPGYWNRPVAASGHAAASLLVVGLAPGMHGANRTGRPFTGDASGDLLFAMLDEFKLRRRVRITNALKCLPFRNAPTAGQLGACRPFLAGELQQHLGRPGRVVLALGKVAHDNILRAMGHRLADRPFGHGTVYPLSGGTLISSYHCSRYNTQTGRLTEDMFRGIFGRVLEHLP